MPEACAPIGPSTTPDAVAPLWPTAPVIGWRARWIAPPHDPACHSVNFYARRRFDLDRVAPRVLLHVSAESVYLLYVNGQMVGRGPVRGTHRVQFYDTYDVAPLLTAGLNWIALAVHCSRTKSFKHAPSRPAALCQLDGGTIATDETWQVMMSPAHRADVPDFTYQIGRMEWKDLGAEPCGWQIGEDSGEWLSPVVLSEDERIAGKALRARDIAALSVEVFPPVEASFAGVPPLADASDVHVAALMTNEPHRPLVAPAGIEALISGAGTPVALAPPAEGGGVAILLDFAREINGGFRLDIDGPAGAIVDIGYQEEAADGRLNLAMDVYAFADRYILREGRQRVGTEFADRGYRMSQVVIRNFTRPVRVYGATAVNQLYPYERRGSFASSDPTLDLLWTTCVETLRACTTDAFVDCPWRENTLYLNDMIVEAVTSMQAFGDPAIVARCMRLAASQVRPDGLYPAAVPYGDLAGKTAQGSVDRMTLTAGNLTFPLILEEYLLHTGDRATVAELTAGMLPMLERFDAWENESGFCVPPRELWNFIDWSYPLTIENRPTCALEWFRVLALDATARLLKLVDMGQAAHRLTVKAASLARRIDAHFWDASAGCYLEGVNDDRGKPLKTQLPHALAILSGRLGPRRTHRCAAALTRDDLLAPELFMHHFVLRAMVATGQMAAAAERIRRHWFPIVEGGSPTIWELAVHQTGKAGFDGAGSLCHGFSTTPIDFLQRAVLGIRPTAPGFTTCSFQPHAIHLDHAQGRVPTPHGPIGVRWDRSAEGIAAKLTIPDGVDVSLRDGRVLGHGEHAVLVGASLPHPRHAPRGKHGAAAERHVTLTAT